MKMLGRRLRTVAIVGLCAANGCILARPRPALVGPAPAGLGSVDVRYASGSGSTIHAWFIPGVVGRGAVLLLHGAGENRTAMLGRARFLHELGYAVLAPDFQANGESPGRHVTFGFLESFDANASLAYLRQHSPGDRVGVIGISMGGAAALLGTHPLAADALVLESVYPTIDDAVADRFETWFGPFGFVGRAISPAIIGLVAPSIGVTERELRPIDRISQVTAPLLMMSGTDDPYTPLNEAEALFAHARCPKVFWAVAGAGHQDLHAFAPAAYERRVGAFLAATLGQATAAVN